MKMVKIKQVNVNPFSGLTIMFYLHCFIGFEPCVLKEPCTVLRNNNGFHKIMVRL